MAQKRAQPLPRVLHHVAERIGEAGPDGEHERFGEEVRERRRVLERVRRVGIEEAAAIRPDLLDGLLRGDRTLRDRLRGAFDRLGDRVGMEVLDHALRAEEQRR